ncbi:pilus assembly protein TadG-related protein [Arthrobacter sp. zg-Y820]|uniref:pilus assembly protein TadG-related protein n=1 Tax=unclassified Arthrobacter TaxID=235627 RepID=UPI001E49FC83|nr:MULTISPECIES: pilus assembly protein TadG-related protein [unclassified Arthrobacter]MCC9196023.1 pilus assembly protein TadG-related protein [Arthrobacter sp. zg-Y820]MDK1278882.1 pilus assembly protein TadG-related protein [Arthrobacter sp. zg.Y820]WIB08703.1 pilus assembly protein TadG-related protein [Arthrobacter sp. zg-Y820]
MSRLPGAARFRACLHSRAGGEDGQVTILIIGYLLVSLLVVTVVMGASALYLGHKKLLSTADGAALAAADTFSLGPAAGSAGGPAAVLAPAAVQAEVNRYLAATNAGDRLPGLTVAGETGTADGRTARVVLTGVVHPPLVNFLVPDGIPITAVAEARARLSQ